MKKRETPRMTYFLYAAADLSYKEDLKAHLIRQFDAGSLGYVRYSTLDDFFPLSESLNKILADTTTFICLISPQFLAAPFYQSIELRKIITAHYLKRIRFVPLELFNVDLSQSYFHSFVKLSSIKNPIYSSDKEVYFHRLSQISLEVAAEVREANAYANRMEADWITIHKAKSIEEYEYFLRMYPHSIYRAKAKVHLEELKEEKLWKEAQAFDTIPYYLQYLLETPLKRYEEEALFKITEIEGDDNVAGRDAIDNNNLALLFDYKRRFRKGIHLSEVNNTILNILSQPIESLKMERPREFKEGEIFEYIQGFKEREEGLELKGSWLNYLVHKKNTPSEIFAFEHLMAFGNHLHGKVKKVKSRLDGFGMSFFMTFFSVPVLIGLLLATVKWGHFTFSIWIALMLAFLVYFLYRSFLAYTVTVREDQKICDTKLKETKKNLIRLKIAFISHDRMQINKLILFFQNTDEWANAMNAQNEFNYIFKENEMSGEDRPTLVLEGI